MLSKKTHRWLLVAFFAIAMAWVESAVVFYLRTMIHRLQPFQSDPFPTIGHLGPVEMVREFATLIMHFIIGMLAGRTWRTRIAYMAISFGLWDIFYYVFLDVMCGWPHSLLDWDILFLLPLPWWGPVLAPVLIALMMITWGTLASQFERPPAPPLSNWRVWVLNSIGSALALYVFMADTLRVADQGVEVIRHVLPTHFDWPLFLIALALMAAPLIQLCRNLWLRPADSFVSIEAEPN